MAAATCNIKDNIKDNNNNASLTLSASAAPVSSSIDGQENTALLKTLSSVFRKATIVVGRHFNALLRGSSRPSIASTDSNSSLSPPSSPIPTPISAAYDYKVVKKVGDGTTANVYLVKSKQDNRTLAMKVINKTYIHGLTSANKPLSEQIVQEVKLLRAVAGDGQCHTLSIVSAFHDSVNMYIVTERCITDLWELWKEFDHQFPMVLLKTYAAQIAVGLSALHDAGIIHRDIKPENIFIAADGRAVVGDFGMAYRLEAQKSDDPPTTRGLCGTLNYAAYEMLRDEEYSYPVDWFSYGVLLHVLLNKCYVWDSEDREELVRQMQMIPVPIHPARGDAYHIQTLISGLLDLDADTRYGANEIKTHPFFWNCISASQAIITPDFVQGVEELFSHDDVEMENIPFEIGAPYTASSDPLPEFTFFTPPTEDNEPSIAEDVILSQTSTECSENDDLNNASLDQIEEPAPALGLNAVNVSISDATADSTAADALDALLLIGRVCSLDGELPVFQAPKPWMDACSRASASSSTSSLPFSPLLSPFLDAASVATTVEDISPCVPQPPKKPSLMKEVRTWWKRAVIRRA